MLFWQEQPWFRRLLLWVNRVQQEEVDVQEEDLVWLEEQGLPQILQRELVGEDQEVLYVQEEQGQEQTHSLQAPQDKQQELVLWADEAEPEEELQHFVEEEQGPELQTPIPLQLQLEPQVV